LETLVGTDATEELSALIALSRKQALNFGICLGSKPEGTVLKIDRMKASEALGRLAKKESSGNKMTFGTLSSQGRVMSLTCQGDLFQGLAKQTKLFLKTAKLKMAVIVLGPDGSVFEQEQDDEPQQSAPILGPSEPEPSPPEPAAQEQAHDGTVEKGRLKEQLVAVHKLAAGLPSAEKARILEAMRGAAEQIKTGDLAVAEAALSKILHYVQKRSEAPAPDVEKLNAALGKLTPAIRALIAADPGRRGDIETLIRAARDGANDPQSAKAALQRLVAKIKEAPTAASAAQGFSLRALSKARLEWLAIQPQNQSAIGSLKDAIRRVYDRHADLLPAVEAGLSKLDGVVKTINTELHEQLDDVLNAQDAQTRQAHVQTAQNTVARLSNFVETDSIAVALDGNEFDPSFSLIQDIRTQLGEVRSALG
jgi:hypothetical protein